jgi:hypothetical protein
MASAHILTALPECDSSKAIAHNTVQVDTIAVSKERQSLSDLFTIVSATAMIPLSHSREIFTRIVVDQHGIVCQRLCSDQ